MLKKLIRWIMKFQHRRKAIALLAKYDNVQQQEDRTLWIGSYFMLQEDFLNSSALADVYINKLPVATVYIYDSIAEMKKQLKTFLTQLENNNAINTMTLQEFMTNAHVANIHEVFANDVPLREQLLEINDILNKIIEAYNKQTGSFKAMNLSRIIPLFEMFAIIVNRVTLGYLATS